MTDWRTDKREIFQRSYTFSLEYQNFPGMVYSMLPAIADAYDLDEDGRAWLAWLNGNTQNVVTSMLLLEAAPRWQDWPDAVAYWNAHFKALEFDTDRRHQKSKFGEATEKWIYDHLLAVGDSPASFWTTSIGSGKNAFKNAMAMPFMGRISAWSYMEFARILLPFIPDVDGWYLEESSSRSHRNALCLLSGYEDAWGWDREQAELPALLGLMEGLSDLAEELLADAQERNWVANPDGPPALLRHPHVSRLSMESALCTFKSMFKPNRRYPNVYADMMYERIKKAEVRMNRDLSLLWDIRKNTLPERLRLEDNPYDLGLHPVKQNWFRETGEVPMIGLLFPDMESGYDEGVREGRWGERKDKKW